jgi:hypothetical protein
MTEEDEEFNRIEREASMRKALVEITRREWIGLTEQEAAECWSTSAVRTWQAIEAKLKEKNT